MSGAAIDLAAVARARRALETLVAVHPRLTHPDAQARVSHWLDTPENDAPMSRPLDPENTDSLALTMRITRPLADALDAELARFTAQNPGVSASRATIARIALMRAFMSSGNVLASASAPAPVAPVAPAAPAPVARVERAERASSAVPAVAPVPAVDPRQLPLVASLEPAHVEPAAAPKRTRDDDDALAQANDAVRARYCAAIAAKQLVNTHTAARIGCSEGSLRGWAKGDTKTLKSEWLAALAVLLDGLDAKEVPA